MSVPVKVLAIIFLLLLTAVGAKAQKQEIKINQTLTERDAVSGQLMELKLEGITDEMIRPVPSERFEVLIKQNGATHKAKVRSTTQFMIPAKMIPKARPASGATTQKTADDSEQANGMRHFQTVMFTVRPFTSPSAMRRNSPPTRQRHLSYWSRKASVSS